MCHTRVCVTTCDPCDLHPEPQEEAIWRQKTHSNPTGMTSTHRLWSSGQKGLGFEFRHSGSSPCPWFAQTSVLCTAQLWTQNHLEDSHSKACTKPRSRTQEWDIIKQTFSIMNVTRSRPTGVQTCSHVSPMCVFQMTDSEESQRPVTSCGVSYNTWLPLSEPQFSPCWKEANHSSVRCTQARSLWHREMWRCQQTSVPLLLPRKVEERRKNVTWGVFFMFNEESLVLARG